MFKQSEIDQISDALKRKAIADHKRKVIADHQPAVYGAQDAIGRMMDDLLPERAQAGREKLQLLDRRHALVSEMAKVVTKDDARFQSLLRQLRQEHPDYFQTSEIGKFLVETAPTKPKLFDMLQVALADPKRRLKGLWREADPRARAQLHLLSQKLVKATRFELDSGFAAFASGMSLIEPRKVAYLYSSARAPYDLTWIEWNPSDAERGAREQAAAMGWEYTMKGGERDTHSGVLIERDDRFPDRPSVYRASFFSAGDSAKDVGTDVVGWPVSIVFDPDGHSVDGQLSVPDHIIDACLRAAEPTRMGNALSTFWLAKFGRESRTDVEKGTEYLIGEPHVMAVRYMQGSASYGVNSAFGLAVCDVFAPYLGSGFHLQPDLMKSSEGGEIYDWVKAYRPDLLLPPAAAELRKLTRDKYHQAANGLLQEGAGDLRRIATLLGLVNTYETLAGPPQQIDGAKLGRVVNMKKVPYLEYRRLSLVLPNDKPADYRIKKLTNSMIRHRAHMVRGFWRTYKATAKRPAKRVWVQSHQRGDASLGWVVKSYHVEKNPKALDAS